MSRMPIALLCLLFAAACSGVPRPTAPPGVPLTPVAASPARALPADAGVVTEMTPRAAAQAAIAPREPGPPTRVELGLEFPTNGTIFSVGREAFLAGRIDAPFGTPGRVDAVVVIDTSLSTQRSTQARTNPVRDRVRGDWEPAKKEPDASILQAELDSARVLLAEVDPRDTRLALVAFSAADRFEPPRPGRAAWTETGLTREIDELAAGLDRIARRGSAGSTDMAAGLDRAIDELIGLGHSQPDTNAETQRVIVFFTDGTPTQPYETPEENEIAVARAAERAAANGIRIFSFAVGPEALERPLATVEMARRTDGVFTPVRRARDLTVAVQAVRLSGLEEFEIRNVTRGRGAHRLHIASDGRFDALVPLVPGRNVLRIRAVVAGKTAVEERVVHYAPGSARPFVAPELEARRARLVQRAGREVEVHAGDDAHVLDAIDRERRAIQERHLTVRVDTDEDRDVGPPDVDVAAPPPPEQR